MSYVPRVGSIADRALRVLQEAGGDMAGAELAEAIDCSPAGALQPSLEGPIKAGLIVIQKRGGRNYYRAPSAPVAPVEAFDSHPIVRRTVAAADCPTPPLPAFQWPPTCVKCAGAGMNSCHCPLPGEVYDPKTETFSAAEAWASSVQKARAPERFTCGLFSDGRLVIEHAGERMELPRAATEALVAFLERLAS